MILTSITLTDCNLEIKAIWATNKENPYHNAILAKCILQIFLEHIHYNLILYATIWIISIFFTGKCNLLSLEIRMGLDVVQCRHTWVRIIWFCVDESRLVFWDVLQLSGIEIFCWDDWFEWSIDELFCKINKIMNINTKYSFLYKKSFLWHKKKLWNSIIKWEEETYILQLKPLKNT